MGIEKYSRLNLKILIYFRPIYQDFFNINTAQIKVKHTLKTYVHISL